jgi:hypothetical protein
MKTNHIIYIPSKARSEKCHTANLLNKHKIDFLIVVEPQDYDSYKLKYGEDKIVCLDKNNMGLSYSRNFIKNYSKSIGEKYHWQFDDDVKYFQKRQENKNSNCNPLEMLCEIENTISKYSNVEVAGLRDSVFAWTQTKFVSLNKLVASCFLIKNESKAKWSDNMIEDVDYCLQVLMGGNCTIIFNTYLYSKMPNNKDSGGQANFMKYETLQKNLVAKYPSILSMRYDNKKKVEKLAASRVWMSFKQTLKENI